MYTKQNTQYMLLSRNVHTVVLLVSQEAVNYHQIEDSC